MKEHSAVKTYNNFNTSEKQRHFSISEMSSIFEKHGGEPDEPHRHDYFTLLVIQNSSGQHIVDFQEFDLGEHQIYFIAPGQVHQMIEKKASEGFVMVFDYQFLMENQIPLHFIEDLNLFNAYDYSPPLMLSENEFEKIWDYCQEIDSLFRSDQTYRMEAIGAWLKLLLIACHGNCTLEKSDPIDYNHQNDLIKRFKKLIGDHYEEWHSTSQYANAMHITPDHLNKVVKMQTGKTAKEHIQARITIEAKRLLHFSNLSIKEIGFQLGFPEPANFSAFFKKCTGVSPSQFKPN